MTLNSMFYVLNVLCARLRMNRSTFYMTQLYSFLTAHFSVDQDAFKELIQHESDKIKNRLVEFAVYMRHIKVKFTIDL